MRLILPISRYYPKLIYVITGHFASHCSIDSGCKNLRDLNAAIDIGATIGHSLTFKSNTVNDASRYSACCVYLRSFHLHYKLADRGTKTTWAIRWGFLAVRTDTCTLAYPYGSTFKPLDMGNWWSARIYRGRDRGIEDSRRLMYASIDAFGSRMNSVNATRESDAIWFRSSQALHRHALTIDVSEIFILFTIHFLTTCFIKMCNFFSNIFNSAVCKMIT